MPSPLLFWPNDRKLFRQRSRRRLVVPAVAVLMAVLAALVFGPLAWR